MNDSDWYIALLVLESSVDGGKDDPLVEIQYRLIEAPNPDAAFDLACDLGASEQHEYKNEDGETVSWHFAGLHDLATVDGRPGNGAEVYSSISRGESGAMVTEKNQLAVFWELERRDLTAREILDG